MTKSQIFQTLLDQHDDIEKMKAFLLFIKDWEGDVDLRASEIKAKFAQQYAVRESARLLLGRAMYKSFYSSCKSVTKTNWYALREFNYDGTPLTESQIATRDWAAARIAARAA